jgi:hypothetical protein
LHARKRPHIPRTDAMSDGLSAMEEPLKNDVTPDRHYARPAPTINEMRGIRFVVGDPAEPGAGTAPAAPAETPAPAADEPLGTPGLAALQAERARAAAAERRVTELEAAAQAAADAELTEVERLRTENTRLTERLTTTERDALQTSVALETALPANLASRLQGNTREELLADAAALIASFPGVTPKIPAPDPSLGPKNEAPTGSVDSGGERYRAKHPVKQ